MSVSGSPKPLYPSTNDPDLRPSGGRYISTSATNSFPPTQMLEKHFAMSPTEAEHPRFNPLNKGRPRSSSLLNTEDPVAMHLLVETAIMDSAEYEILSFEEVEELKKEYKFLSSRIDVAKRKLALESKVRDAAVSLSRLYNSKKGKRRSLLGGNEMTQKTDEELIQSNQKVEQLVQELWGLNNRAVEIHRRLLQHGAGILGMTHQGGIKPQGNRGPAPTSPNGRNGVADDFDDRSFYRTSDNLDGFSTNGANRHRRGPSMDQLRQNGRNSQQFDGIGSSTLDPAVERCLEKLNNELRQFLMGTVPGPELPAIPQCVGNGSGVNRQLAILEQAIQFIQQYLPSNGPNNSEELEQTMTTLWDMMVLGNEDNRTRRASTINGKAPSAVDLDSDDEDGDGFGTSFSVEGFSYKVQALYNKAMKLRADRAALRTQLDQQTQRIKEEREIFQQKLQDREEELGLEINKLEGEIEQLNETITSRDKSLTAANQELDILTDEIKAIQEELRDREDERDQVREDLQAAQREMAALRNRLEEESQSRDKDSSAVLAFEKRLKEKEDAEVVLMSKIAGLEGLLKDKEAAEDDLLEKLREKETEIIARVEMEDVLRRSLKEKEVALASRNDSEEAWDKRLQESATLIRDLQGKLEGMKEDRVIMQAELDASKAELSTIMASTEARVKALEEDLENLKKARAEAEQARTVALEEVDKFKRFVDEKDDVIAKMEIEKEELVENVARLSTEVAVVKAELDEAYGSKSQRAAATAEAQRAAAALEAANKTHYEELAKQNQALLQEIGILKAELDARPPQGHPNSVALEKRNQLLQAELNGMLQDFEGLTKQSIEFENERTQLEGMIDQLKDKVEALETALAEERIRILGGGSSRSPSVSVGLGGELPAPAPRSGMGESMSTQVLKSEFKKMMRDMRAEHMKALRAEQEERRKLEGLIRKMKQEQLQSRRTEPVPVVAAI